MNIPESYLLSNKLDKMVKHPLSDTELKNIRKGCQNRHVSRFSEIQFYRTTTA